MPVNRTLQRCQNRGDILMSRYFDGSAPAFVVAGDPVLAFSDLVSAPRSGWSNATDPKGAVVSVWGVGFGTFSEGNTYVTVGGVVITAASDFPTTWGEVAINPHLRRISFHLNENVPLGLQPVTVTVNGKTTGIPLFINITEQGIYFADPNATGGTGTLGDPWQDPVNFTSTAQPGDVLYCRGGTYSDQIDGGLATWYIRPDGAGNPANDGTAANPVAICGYPNETALVDALTTQTGSKYRGIEIKSNYYTLSNLNVKAEELGINAGGSSNGRGIRVIGCDIESCKSLAQAGHLITQGSDHRIFGNKGHGGRSGNKLDHAFYISGDAGDGGVHLGFNYAVDNNFDTGPIITVNHQDTRIPSHKRCASHHIYGNFIDSTAFPAVGIMIYHQSWNSTTDTAGPPEYTYIYNNILTGCGVDRSFPAMSQQGAKGMWFFNIIHNCKGTGMEMANSRLIDCQFVNNILVLTEDDEPGGWEYVRPINLSGTATYTIDNNCYWGSDGNFTAPESLDANALLVDPQVVVDLVNATVSVGAAMLTAGVDHPVAKSVATSDYNMVDRQTHSVGVLVA